jgi:ABC-type molybdate transport system substrate-binding protein
VDRCEGSQTERGKFPRFAEVLTAVIVIFALSVAVIAFLLSEHVARQHARALVAATLFILTFPGQTQAESIGSKPLLLYASNVSKAAIEPLVPICARAARTEVQARYANNPEVAKDIADGAYFDVAVIETHMLEALSKQVRVAKNSIQRLAALRMAIATRESGPDPRTDTVPAFKRALLGARSIGYIGNGHSGEVFLEVVDRLKLRGRLAGKLVPFSGAYAEAAQVSERLQYVVAPFFNPLPSPLRLVGYFPRSLGADVDLSVGASPGAKLAAAKFIDCLRSPDARAVFRSKGFRLDR